MDEEQVKQLLQSRRPPQRQRGLRCPDENQLAAFVDGQLTKNERTTFERHLSSCGSCLDTIAFLAQSGGWSNSETPPPYLVARARAFVTEKRAGWHWQWAIATAAAACVVLVLSLIVFKSRVEQPTTNAPLIAQEQPSPPPIVNTPAAELPRPAPTRSAAKADTNRAGTPSVRGGESSVRTETVSTPRLLFPHEGSVVRRRELECRWQPVPDAQFYTVRLSELDGGLILEKETKESRLKVGDDVELQNNASYFVIVIAHSSDGRAIKSELVKFRLKKD